jgi:DNA polymerase III epsilon subunit-like protein
MKGRVAKGAACRQLIAERQFIALDIETTETKVTTAAPSVTYPVPVGVVLFMNDSRRDPQHFTGNPGVPMDKASSARNGIRTADLLALTQDVPAMLAELDAYLAKYPDAYLVCHNANFDIRHLCAACERAGMTPFSRNVLDTEFLPKRLELDGVPTFSKLDNMRIRYNISTTIPAATARLRKGLKDAQDTAELLGWLMAEAADKGIITFPGFITAAKVRTSEDIASAYTRRRVPMTRPSISATHIRNLHRGALPAKPSDDDLDRWAANAATCVRLRCPHLVEKVTRNDLHAALLLPRLTALLPSCTKPGDLGTLLNALEPLMLFMTRDEARAWYKASVARIRTGAACEPAAACPACVADQSCPKDTICHLLTRRSLDYGQTSRHKPVSLLSKQAKKDLWDGESFRKTGTWPRQGMADMAAYMVWMVLLEARARRETTTETKLLDKAVERNLHLEDPRLALELARHWAKSSTHGEDIEEFVSTVLAKATSDHGFAQLEIWFHGPYQRTVAARDATDARKVRARKVDPERKPADIELRPPEAQHAYRYQIRRRPAVPVPAQAEQPA